MLVAEHGFSCSTSGGLLCSSDRGTRVKWMCSGGEEPSEGSEVNANAAEVASEQSEALYTVFDTVALEDSLRDIQVAALSRNPPSGSAA